MSDITIVAVCDRNQEVVIRLANWGLLALGQGHFVLQNTNEVDPLFRNVIGICIHEVESTPSVFLEIYEALLASRKVLANALLPRRILKIVSGESECMVNHLKKMTQKKIVFPTDLVLYLADDLRKSQQNWNYFLEFKPKTPFPDIYSEKLIEKIAFKLNYNKLILKNFLKERPIIEKTRWFKKNMLGKGNNINPLQIFLNNGDEAKYQRKIRRIDGIEANSPQQIHALSKKISKNIQESAILKNILTLQQLFLRPCDSVQLNLERINNNMQNITIDLLKSEIMNSLNQQIQNSSLLYFLQSQPLIVDSSTPNNPLDYLASTFKFLTSFTWRDVSLIVRFKTDENLNITAFDIKIIDYQLKQMSKLATILKKDEKFLLNYLQQLKT